VNKLNVVLIFWVVFKIGYWFIGIVVKLWFCFKYNTK